MINPKKILSIFLAVMVSSALSISAYAEESHFEPIDSTAYAIRPSDSINYTYVNIVLAGFFISGSKGGCDGSFSLYSSHPVRVTVSLMKSKNGTSWSTVESWEHEYSSTSYQSLPTHYSTDDLESGYYYCTHVQVQVLNSNGRAIETGSCDSASRYYN